MPVSEEWLVEYKGPNDREWIFGFTGPEPAAKLAANRIYEHPHVSMVRLVQKTATVVRERRK